MVSETDFQKENLRREYFLNVVHDLLADHNYAELQKDLVEAATIACFDFSIEQECVLTRVTLKSSVKQDV